MPDTRRLRVVVVGGSARSARAFRQYISLRAKFDMTILVRKPIEALPGEVVVPVLDYFSAHSDVLHGADAIVNFVGVAIDSKKSMLRALNVEGPMRLAQRARASGVKHFVQLSSLHVYGDTELVDGASIEVPFSPYARSKLAGDKALFSQVRDHFLITVIRMPMHYGYGAGKKLKLLMRLIMCLGWFPVPKRRVERSVIHLDNLAAAIAFLIEHKLGGVRFVADPQPVSIDALIDVLNETEHRVIKVVRLPEFLFLPLRIFAGGIYRRLYRNNVISHDALVRLDYPVNLREGLKDLVAHEERT